ncbi:MAG: polymerase [Firmicutes bacterium]|nr:polymerase [Bacillota bacterium]
MLKKLTMDGAIYYCLLGYAFVSSISIAASNFFVSLAGLLAIYLYIKKPYKIELNRGLGIAVGIFMVAVAISAIAAYQPINTLDRLWAYLYRMLPLVLAVAFIKTRQRLVMALVIMAISIIISDGYAIWQGIGGDFKAKAFSAHSMIFAGYLIQMIPLAAVIGLKSNLLGKRAHALMIGAITLSMVALVFNGTRGAWIAIAVTFIVYGLLNLKRDFKAIAGILAVLMIFGVLFASNNQIKERFNSIADMSNQSNSERVLMWRSAWNMFLDHPITGVGAGNYPKQYQTRYILPEAKERMQGHPHNNFLNTMAETGIVGCLAFVYMFGYILVYFFRRRGGDNEGGIMAMAAFLVTVSLLVQGMTEYNYGDSAVIRMYWFIIGLAYAGKAISSENKISQ